MLFLCITWCIVSNFSHSEVEWANGGERELHMNLESNKKMAKSKAIIQKYKTLYVNERCTHHFKAYILGVKVIKT